MPVEPQNFGLDQQDILGYPSLSYDLFALNAAFPAESLCHVFGLCFLAGLSPCQAPHLDLSKKWVHPPVSVSYFIIFSETSHEMKAKSLTISHSQISYWVTYTSQIIITIYSIYPTKYSSNIRMKYLKYPHQNSLMISHQISPSWFKILRIHQSEIRNQLKGCAAFLGRVLRRLILLVTKIHVPTIVATIVLSYPCTLR